MSNEITTVLSVVFIALVWWIYVCTEWTSVIW
ncbi:uncharacterized protein METZ01_LOCUS491390 [marine metagenome]|uniref:Uncharacterized protein n=1 Tax=marine metagenome TaxID=408172 RepID=A0A383D1W6_9ZZZZ